MPRAIFVSATPAEYELNKSHGTVVEQVVRPTGLLDPEIEVRPTEYQIDNLMNEIVDRIDKQERTLVVTLTKRMAEKLNRYLCQAGIRSAYGRPRSSPHPCGALGRPPRRCPL